MVDEVKRMPDIEERKGKVLDFRSHASGSESQPKKSRKAKALDEAPENKTREDEEDRFSDSLQAGWQALIPEARSEVIMEDLADYRADGSLLASARYYSGIRKKIPKFRTSDENYEGGIPNPFDYPQHEISNEEDENCCIERAFYARCKKRPASHMEHCECELCAKHKATQPLDAMARKEKDIFYKMEDIMCRLAEESDHPALTDYVFDTFGKFYGAMHNVWGETMDQLHVVYNDDCECMVCNNYAAAPQAGKVSVKTPVVTKPAARPQAASVGTVVDFEDQPGWI